MYISYCDGAQLASAAYPPSSLWQPLSVGNLEMRLETHSLAPGGILRRYTGVNKTGHRVQRAFYIPLDVADDERGRRLLDILLLATTVVVLLIITSNVTAAALGMGGSRVDLARMNVVSVAVLLGNGLVFALNRRSPWLAKWLFVLLLFAAAISSDSPQQMASGRNLIALAIPVIAANILLHPFMGFVVASLGCLMICVVAHSLDIWVPASSMAMLFLMALIAALLVHALERTLIGWRTADYNCYMRDLRWGSGVAVMPAVLGGVPGGAEVVLVPSDEDPGIGTATVTITNETDDTIYLEGTDFGVFGGELTLAGDQKISFSGYRCIFGSGGKQC